LLLIPRSKTRLLNLQLQAAKLITSAWYFLRSPKMTGVLLAILAVVLGLGLIIPQQPDAASSVTVRDTWVANLSPSLQPWGEFLYFLGFSRLFNSPWFWLPLGLLGLNSLIALADYSPGSWQRVQPAMPGLHWQHPLARRTEQSTRLPEAPDLFLDTLKTRLGEQGFYIYPPSEIEPRMIGAAQRRWVWLGPIVFYVGLLINIVALVISHYFLQVDTLTLWPLEAKTTPLFAGKFELTAVDPGQQMSQVIYASNGSDPSFLNWRLYIPAFFQNTLIWPRAMEPILTIEARDETGALLRLIPSQENLFPAERLHLPLAQADSPVYFLIPSTGLAFQITPDASTPDLFKVQVRRGTEVNSATEIEVRAGETFAAEKVKVTMSLDSNMTVFIHRDPALPLYLIGLALLITAGIFLVSQPPLQLWFIPEVKGRGGQLYSVVEKFGSVAELPPLVATLLNREA
jgi:hypothetical protein